VPCMGSVSMTRADAQGSGVQRIIESFFFGGTSPAIRLRQPGLLGRPKPMFHNPPSRRFRVNSIRSFDRRASCQRRLVAVSVLSPLPQGTLATSNGNATVFAWCRMGRAGGGTALTATGGAVVGYQLLAVATTACNKTYSFTAGHRWRPNIAATADIAPSDPSTSLALRPRRNSHIPTDSHAFAQKRPRPAPARFTIASRQFDSCHPQKTRNPRRCRSWTSTVSAGSLPRSGGRRN